MNGKTNYNKTDSKDMNVTFESGDNKSPISFQDVDLIANKETHQSIFKKISIMIKNIRYLFNLIGDPNLIPQKTGLGTIADALTSATNPFNFTNHNLNGLNIDETYMHNYVVGISEDGHGTRPTGDSWWNIINFYSVHFITQIAFANGNGNVLYIRNKYAGNAWGEWKNVRQSDIDDINNRLGSVDISNIGPNITHALHNTYHGSINKISNCLLGIGETKYINLEVNQIYLVLCLPWNTTYNCQSIYMVSTMSQVSIQCLNSDTNQNVIELSRFDVNTTSLSAKNNAETGSYVLVYKITNGNWDIDDGLWTTV